MRKRMWSSDAERMRAKRAGTVTPENEQADAPNENEHVKTNTLDVRIEAVTFEPTDAPVEQWRLDAREYLKTGKLPKLRYPSPGFVSFVDQPHVPHDPQAPPWLGAGRGVVRTYKGRSYVLVARHTGNVAPDALEHGVVTAYDHAARLTQRCEHKLTGWACHQC